MGGSSQFTTSMHMFGKETIHDDDDDSLANGSMLQDPQPQNQ